MAFPSGWTHKFKLTIDRTKVTGTPTGFVLLVTKDMLPTSVVDAGSASAQDGGGDIRFTHDSAGTQRLPIEVVDFHPDSVSGNRRCEIWVNMAGFEPSSSADKVIYGWCKGPSTMLQPGPSMPCGAESVWSSQDYRAVHHGNNSHIPEPYGLWLIRPRAVEASGATYVTWLDANHGGTGNIRVAKYTHSTGVWTPAVTVAAAELIDAHGAPSICVDSTGRILVTWGGFSDAAGRLRCARSTNAADISAWGSPVNIATGLTEPTYPTMLCLSSGTLVLFSREADNWVRRVSTDNGASWANAQTIVAAPDRSYTEWVLGPSDRVHVAWHTTASSGSINGLNLYYAYSDNPAAATSTWKAVDGTTLTVPVVSSAPTTVSTGRVFNTTGASFNTSYLRGLAVDGSNNPMLSCDSYVTGTPASSAASSFTYSGGSWTRVDILTGATVGLASSGSFTRAEGGVRFLTGTTWRTLIGVTVSGLAEVQEWETTNGGTSWSKAADVTASSSRGNWQSQYVRGTTGPLVATHFATGPSNNTGSVYNSVSDSVWVYGAHTDYVGSWAREIMPAVPYLRDSTKYHNEATAVGSPTQGTGPAPFGGYGQNLTASNYYSMPNVASIGSALASALHIQFWAQHTSAGSAEKTACKNPSAGNTTPWLTYRDGSNNFIVFFGNGSAFVAPTSAGGASGTYRAVAQFFSNSGSARLNKTAISGAALTGPLATVSDPVHIGETMIGMQDEFRMSITQISAATLDTEYDNQNSPATFAAGLDLLESAGLELATASDSSTAIRAGAAASTESATAADAAFTTRTAAAAATETATPTESAAAAGTFLALVAEVSTATDVCTTALLAAAAVTEVAPATEVSAALPSGAYVASAIETAPAADASAATATKASAITEAAAATDSSTALRATFAQALETANSIDVSAASWSAGAPPVTPARRQATTNVAGPRRPANLSSGRRPANRS